MRALLALSLFTAMLLSPFGVPPSNVSGQATEPRVADPNTRFHRLYVLGAGTASEQSAWEDDLSELKGDLERGQNQGDGSSSSTMRRPTKQELRDAVNRLKETAQPGEEVTFYFSGHGGNQGAGDANGDETDGQDEFIWLRDANGNGQAEANEIVTDDELAEMLSGFRRSVTLVVIMDSCFGGGMTGGTSDIQESDHVAVIGTSGTCETDPAGILGAFVETVTEAVADKAGEKSADQNGDGIVTAAELKRAMEGQGFSLGPPEGRTDAEKKPKSGKSKCVPGGCDPPPPLAQLDRSSGSPASVVNLSGQEFAPSSQLSVELVKPDLTRLRLTSANTGVGGSFTTQAVIPDVPDGQYLLHVIDAQFNRDWFPFTVFRERTPTPTVTPTPAPTATPIPTSTAVPTATPVVEEAPPPPPTPPAPPPAELWILVVEPTEAYSVTDELLWFAAPGEWYSIVLQEAGWALAVWEFDAPEWAVWLQLDGRVQVLAF